MMMISQNLVTHPLELVIISACIIQQYMYTDMYHVYTGIQEIIKGDGVDDDSGLGTSRYKSSLSYTISDVRTDTHIYGYILTNIN